MALVLKDRVKETTTTTGTGTVTLAGAAAGYQAFSAIGNSNTTYYVIEDANNAWEVGIGTYTLLGTTLSRDTILANSAGDTSAITLSSGTHTVFCGYPAGKSVNTGDNLSVMAATTSSQLAGVISDETGSGSLVFATSPTLVTPALGTPASGTLTNCTFPTLNQNTTGTATIATTVTVADESSDTTCFPLFVTAATGNLGPKSGSNLSFNASTGILTATGFAGDLTGDVTGNADTVTNGVYTSNNLSVMAATSSSQLAGVISDETGSGSLVFATSPTLVTPALGTPSALVGTNISGTASSLTAGTATVATTVTITDNESTNEDNAIIFAAGGDVDGGNLGLESDGTLTYNPSTGKITATGFIGALTGNADTVTSGVYTTNNLSVMAATTSSQLAGVISDETGSGALVFATSPTLVTPALGTPSALVATNATGTAASLTAGTATVATTVTITDNESTDEDNAIIFTAGGDVDGGNLGLESDGDLTYNPSTGTVTATVFVGALTGNVTGNASGTAATVTGGTQASITSAANLVTVGTIGTGVWQGTAIDGAYIDIEGTEVKSTGEGGGSKFLREDGDGTCSWQTVSAGTATAVTVADESSDTTCFPLFVTAATGDLGPKSGTNLTFNSSTGVLAATGFSGPLTGNVTGDASGSSGSCTGNAATATLATDATSITVSANNTADETVYPLFVDGATGSQGAETDTGLTYNPSSGLLTSTAFAGDITGDVTGNASGSSGSCTGNAATATALASARTINGVSFDGTGNITVTAAGSTLSDTVTVAKGGTGATSLTDGGILLGSGTGAITALAVLGDGVIVVGDNSTDPTTITAFTASDGVLKHEVGGLELDISGIAIGDVLAGTGTGAVGIVTSTGHSDGDVLTIQADGTVDWEAVSGGGGGISWDGSTANGVATYKDGDEATVESNLTFDGSTLVVAGNMKVNQYIEHNGDDNNYIRFRADQQDFVAGGKTMLTLDENDSQDILIINTNGADVDFRVEGDSDENLLRTDAANDRVGISTDSPTALFDIANTLTYDGTTLLSSSTTDNTPPIVQLKHAYDDTTGGILKFALDKGAAGADGDVCGTITFFGDDDNQDNIEFARIEGVVADASNGDECGALKFYVAENDGTNTAGFLLTGSTTDGEVDATIGAGAASVITIPGHIDLAGDIDVDGTLEADAITLGGTALGSLYSPIAGSSSIVTVGTISTGVWQGTAIGASYVATLNQDTTGTAAIATTVTVADESSDTTCFPLFVTAATGDLGPKSGDNLTFNSSTGVLTATGFAGPLTGNVTGNASGTALTVTQAAQSAITSVGTLTSVVVADGGNIGSASDTDAISIASTGAVTFSKATKPALKSNTDASTVTFDVNEANVHTVTLGANRVFAISNETAGQKFMIRIQQDATGSRTVTWFSTIKWAGGSAPTLTTTANKADVVGFLVTGTDTYDGFVIGQNI